MTLAVVVFARIERIEMGKCVFMIANVKYHWHLLTPPLIAPQDEITKKVHTHYGNYKEALTNAHSEYYLGKDCWGTRCGHRL